MSNDTRGVPPAPPYSGDKEAMAMTQKHYEAQVQAMVQQLQMVALPFAPKRFREEPNLLLGMAEYLIREQTQYMETVVPAMIMPQEGFPEIEMYVWKAGTGPEVKPSKTELRIVQADGALPPPTTMPDFSGADPAILDCPKRLEGIEDPMQAMCQALCYSFLMNPAARAILRMNGWLYYFGQTEKAPS